MARGLYVKDIIRQAVKARRGRISKEQTGIEIATAELQAAPDYQTAVWPGLRLPNYVVWQKYGPVSARLKR